MTKGGYGTFMHVTRRGDEHGFQAATAWAIEKIKKYMRKKILQRRGDKIDTRSVDEPAAVYYVGEGS